MLGLLGRGGDCEYGLKMSNMLMIMMLIFTTNPSLEVCLVLSVSSSLPFFILSLGLNFTPVEKKKFQSCHMLLILLFMF